MRLYACCPSKQSILTWSTTPSGGGSMGEPRDTNRSMPVRSKSSRNSLERAGRQAGQVAGSSHAVDQGQSCHLEQQILWDSGASCAHPLMQAAAAALHHPRTCPASRRQSGPAASVARHLWPALPPPPPAAHGPGTSPLQRCRRWTRACASPRHWHTQSSTAAAVHLAFCSWCTGVRKQAHRQAGPSPSPASHPSAAAAACPPSTRGSAARWHCGPCKHYARGRGACRGGSFKKLPKATRTAAVH